MSQVSTQNWVALVTLWTYIYKVMPKFRKQKKIVIWKYQKAKEVNLEYIIERGTGSQPSSSAEIQSLPGVLLGILHHSIKRNE
jgi:hypothetical protein